mmetsp:Transcript_3474/g.5964  ORF Transcript_3474/g.5964 Transcript_3474/m.5964 type:complete len:391 (-) Transcript_3474:34-1206(-)
MSFIRRVAYGALGGVTASLGYDFYRQDERAFRAVFMPMILATLDGEDAHRLGIWAARNKLFPQSSHVPADSMKTKLFDMELTNPLGIAAGFDKNGEAIEGIARMGFGFVEIGSVTPEPQAGNPRPRVFRLFEDKAVINRYGFNSDGHSAVELNIRSYKFGERATPCVLGINLGKNKTSESALEDYSKGVKVFAEHADYLVVNISSPNTPGLRNLQAKSELDGLISGVLATRDEACKDKRKVPLLLKIAPDLTEQDKKDIAEVVLKRGVDGLIVSNTTVTRPESLQGSCKQETGGLSGRPLKHLSTAVIGDMYKLTHGSVPIIGVGGIENGKDAYEKIRAGASVVQVYSAITFQGPPIAKRIIRELEDLLAKDGVTHVADAVGMAHTDLKK